MSDKPMASVTVDASQVYEALDGTGRSLPSIRRQTVGIAARSTAKVIRGLIRQTTDKGTGELRKAYGYKVKKGGESASVFPKGSRLLIPKIASLSYGNQISARDGHPWMQIHGVAGWYARPQSVYIAPRGFVQGGEKYAEDGLWMSEVDRMVEKQLSKCWGG